MKSQHALPYWRMSGYTLLEIMVVVVIIGLLAAMIVPNLVGNLDTAAVNRAKADIQTIESALNLFYAKNFRYPANEEGLEILVGKGPGIDESKAEKFLQRLSLDPWDRSYLYAYPGEHGEFDVYTLGADGKEGGDDADADIGNWNLD